MEIKSLIQYDEMVVEYQEGEIKSHREQMTSNGWKIKMMVNESPFKGDKVTYTYRKEIK